LREVRRTDDKEIGNRRILPLPAYAAVADAH
jgi:hypothetical protein